MSQTFRSRFANRRLAGIFAQAGLAAAMLIGTHAMATAQTVAPDGIWYDEKGSTIIKFAPCSTAYCGTIVWLKEPTQADGSPQIDSSNPDVTKQKRPIVGLEIFSGLTAEDDHWKGRVYNPDNGKVYDVTIKVRTDKEPNDKADVRGCVLRVLCGTETFSRAADVPGGDPTLAEAPTTAPAKKRGAKKDTAKK